MILHPNACELARFSACWMIVLCASLVEASVAPAQEEPAQSTPSEARSRALFDSAIAARNTGDLQRALCLMQGAQAQSPHNAFLFNIAQLKRDLGQCVDARAGYQDYLARESDPVLRRAAQTALTKLQDCRPGPALSAPHPGSAECAQWTAAALAPAPSEPIPAVSVPVQPAPQSSPERPPAAVPIPKPAPIVRESLPPVSPPATPALVALTWIMAGSGMALGAVAGYEASEVVSANQTLSEARSWNAELAALERSGERAETLAWLFGAGSVALLTAALVVHFQAHAGPQADQRAQTKPTRGAPALLLRF
jgi:hypothetical protein